MFRSSKKNWKLRSIIIGLLLSAILLAIAVYINEERIFNNEEYGTYEEQEKRWSLQLYRSESTGDLCGEANPSFCNEFAFEIVTKTPNAKILDLAYDSYVLYLDDEIYLYNDNDKKSIVIPIAKDAVSYTLENLYDPKQIYKQICGISMKKNEKAAYYNIKTNKVMYDGKFSDINSIDDDLLEAHDEEHNSCLLDAKEEKEPYIKSTGDTFYEKVVVDNDYYIELKVNAGAQRSYYTKDYKKITEFTDRFFISINSDGNVVVYEKDFINEYNLDAQKVKSFKPTGEVMSIHKDLYLELKDNAFYIKEYNGDEYKLRDMEEGNFYHAGISGYYGDDMLSGHKKAGYYFAIEYDRENGKGIEYYFNYDTKELTSQERQINYQIE